MISTPDDYMNLAYPMSATLIAILALITYFLLKEHRAHMCFVRRGKEHLSINEIRLISLGLVYAEEKRFYTDSLTTGLKEKQLDLILKDDWGILDRESALINLQKLCARGDRLDYIDIQPYINGGQETSDCFCEHAENEEISEVNRQMNLIVSLNEHIFHMHNHFIFPFNTESLSRGIMAWDTSRLVALTRMSYDKKFITKEQAWRFLNDAYDMAYINYQDWREYAVGYLIGSAMRRGSDIELQEKITELSENALTNRESPWNIVKFKGLS